MIEIGINSQILKQIIDGKKTVEGRLAKGKFLTIRPGDSISIREDIYVNNTIVESRKSAAIINVIEVYKFNSFREMITQLGLHNVLPNSADIDHACNEYERYYSHEDENKYGVVGITFHAQSTTNRY